MTDVQQSHHPKPGSLIRSFRKEADLSLEQFAERIHEDARTHAEECSRPSLAKLSRIETGENPVSLDILPALSRITGRDAAELRPDLAKLFAAKCEQ